MLLLDYSTGSLAVGVAALATEAGLSWLRHKIGAEDQSSLAVVRGVGSASRGYLVSQSLEEVIVHMWEGSHGQIVARRDVRSFVATGPTSGRK
jgi:hypothetical protein